MNHKRTCVHLSVDMAKRMLENFGDSIKIDMDILISGAILLDIGKLLEYEMQDGKLGTSSMGKMFVIHSVVQPLPSSLAPPRSSTHYCHSF